MSNQEPISFPALGISPGNSVYIWRKLREEYQTNAYAIVRGYWSRLTLYDSSGLSWSVKSVSPELSAVQRMVAPLYNPKMTVSIAFTDPRPYNMDELKMQLTELVDRDEDVLTQHIAPADLKAAILRGTTVNHLIGELQRYRVVDDHP